MSLPGIIGSRIQRMGPDPTAVPLIVMNNGAPIRPHDPYSVTVPYAGLWRLMLWGGGSAAYTDGVGGQSGQLYIAERHLNGQQPLIVRTGRGGSQGDGNNTDSYVILPTGEQITAFGGTRTSNALLPVRVNNSNDLAFMGSDPGRDGLGDNPGLGGGGISAFNTNNGGGAPGWGGFRGGDGGYYPSGNYVGGMTPGGGGAYYSSAVGGGGDGLILLCLMRLD